MRGTSCPSASVGSSPRTRGTYPWETLGASISVHPRGRGEHINYRTGAISVSGSSPRTRGTYLRVAFLQNSLRFIPADAGNIAPMGQVESSRTVHPRGRGEQIATSRSRIFLCSVHPRGRGEHAPRRRWRASMSVHPRGRGEHPLSSLGTRVAYRFIPADAGNMPNDMAAPGCGRFIPADAGNMSAGMPRCMLPPVHPRGRGEHNPSLTSLRRLIRFIPADAGNMLGLPGGDGEEPGSSPRTRGTSST